MNVFHIFPQKSTGIYIRMSYYTHNIKRKHVLTHIKLSTSADILFSQQKNIGSDCKLSPYQLIHLHQFLSHHSIFKAAGDDAGAAVGFAREVDCLFNK